MGAMCYRMGAPPDRAEYSCPTCGERTLYPKPANWRTLLSDRSKLVYLIEFELPEMRRAIATIVSLRVSLDESSLCQACKPQATVPSVALEVEYADHPTRHRVPSVTLDDVKLLHAFATGADRHVERMGREIALADEARRLRALLGLRSTSRKK